MLGGRGDGGGSGGGAERRAARATEEFDQAGPGEEAGGAHGGPKFRTTIFLLERPKKKAKKLASKDPPLRITADRCACGLHPAQRTLHT